MADPLPPSQWTGTPACRGLDPEMFFPERGDHPTVRGAKEVCAGCSVRAECAEYALHHEKIGIWGGLSERERRVIRRTRGIEVKSLTAMSNEVDCGTWAGYLRHRRAGEDPCSRCSAAQRVYSFQMNARRACAG